LTKSLDTIAALRSAMERRLAEMHGAENAPMIEKPPKFTPPPEAVNPPTPPEPETPLPEPEAAPPEPEKPAEPQPAPKPDESRGADKSPPPLPDPAEWPRIMFRIADRSQKLIQDYLERNKNPSPELPAFDPAHISEAFLELLNRIVQDPE